MFRDWTEASSYVQLLDAAEYVHIVVVVVGTAQPRGRLHLEYLIGLAADLEGRFLLRDRHHVADGRQVTAILL